MSFSRENFEQLKAKGLFKYSSYEEYLRETEQEDTEIKPDPQVKKDYEQWKDNLPKEDKGRFKECFEEEGLIKDHTNIW